MFESQLKLFTINPHLELNSYQFNNRWDILNSKKCYVLMRFFFIYFLFNSTRLLFSNKLYSYFIIQTEAFVLVLTRIKKLNSKNKFLTHGMHIYIYIYMHKRKLNILFAYVF